MIPTALHERLLAAAGDRTYRHIGDLTKTHPETVRRYMQGQAPGADFLAALCAALSISGDWLLTGRGPMKLDEQRAHALRDATAGDLLAAMAGTIERLSERIDRLETYVQTLEVRIRSAAAPAGEPHLNHLNSAQEPGHGSSNGQLATAAGPAIAKPVAGPSPDRVRRLQRALAQRPRPHAD
ncbi:MAG: hypothetical protein IT436_11240 [Phycisphaerales bacterium]|nr:hypothetical protein [Phycisphaerales bacterium]